MPKIDRGIIKWMPFNSVIPTGKIINEIEKEKEKIKKPILDENEINEIEKKLIENYFEKNKVSVYYFYNGNINNVNDYIKKIDFVCHKIYFSNQVLLFEQIIKIS